MKKLITILLVASMILSLTTPIVSADTTPFKDLIKFGKKHWAYDTIMKLADAKVIGGFPDGTYKPEESVTREQFVKLLVEALKLEKVNRQTFDDINGIWSQIYIETAAREGIIIPSEIGRYFRPTEPITRKDAAYMISRGLRIEPYRVWQPTHGYPYMDTLDPTIAKLYGEYLLNGNLRNGLRYFDSDRNMTRAEAATVIERVMEYKNDKASYKAVKKAELVNSLVKATPDAEFEKFMQTEEAKKYASTDTFTVKDGAVTFHEFAGWDYGDIIIENPGYKDINKAMYNVIKLLVNNARKYNHYVKVSFLSTSHIYIQYFDSYDFGTSIAGQANFNITFYASPEDFGGTKDKVYLRWEANRLWTVDDFKDLDIEVPAINFTQDKFLQPMQAAFNTVYGTTDGQKLYEYLISEYRLENSNPITSQRINQSLITINGIEVKNYNDNSFNVWFTTNIKK